MGLGVVQVAGQAGFEVVAVKATPGSTDKASGKLDKGRFINNFKKGQELVERFRSEFGGVTCQELQQRFTGRTYDMWQAEQYQAFSDARGEQCARATASVTKWVVEML